MAGADDFARFAAAAAAAGYDETQVRDWPAAAVVDQHDHPFAVLARVVAGEMWLTAEGATRHLRPGDEFTLAAGQPHAERYGASGATYWVARRH
ncbi:cupin domain-containing protein [Azonexus sp.]|uniref:cupin domain-containing protein n=1 Tax=Azonexus sp. TaxID=1872668 RepID=UPI0035ADE040